MTVVVAALMFVSMPTAQAAAVTTIFAPTSDAGFTNPGVMYARSVMLQHHGAANGNILTTFEVYTGNTPPVFPIHESTDGGVTWAKVGQVTDTVNGYGMRWNPQIYELPAALGNLPAGTILVSGESVPADVSTTEILVYASTDRGRTWRFLSSVAKGSRADGNPVWEPFFLMHNGRLIVYYSDERDPSHSQKLVHQVTTNGISWGPIVDDVAYPTVSARPGMSTVARIGGGHWILTYEYCNAPSGGCPVYYKIATDPENFNAATGQQLLLNNTTRICCQPYVVWTPIGGPNGTIVVAAGGALSLAVNTAGGDASAWRSQASNAPGGYSRSLMVMPGGNTVMTLTGGYHDSDYLNSVQFAFDQIATGTQPPTTPPTGTPPSTTPPTTGPTTAPPSPTTPPSSPPGSNACRVSVTVNAWNTGLTATITVTNTGSSTLDGWALTFALPAGQVITQGWNATFLPPGGQVTATSVSHNARLAPGRSATIGYLATHTGNSAAPAGIALNGNACTVA